MYKSWESRWNEIDGNLNIFCRLAFRFLVERTLRSVFRFPQKFKILEIGCGGGYTMSFIKNLGYDIYGVDNSRQAVELCKRKGLKVRLASGDKIPFPSKSFDIVFSEGMLAHQKSLKPFVKEIARLSNRALIIVPNQHSLFYKILKKHIKEYKRKVSDYNLVFNEFGFNLKKGSSRNYHHVLFYEIS